MKTLYIECAMGAAGDMLMAALSELLPEPERFTEKMRSLGIPGVEYERTYTASSGIRGAHMRVFVKGEEEQSEDIHDAHHAHEHGTLFHDADGAHDHAHHHDGHHDDKTAHDHDHEHHHHHTSLAEIREIVDGFAVSEKVRADILAVYGIIAEAESRAHGRPVEEIHFHEVGAMDAVADITGVCLLMDMLGADRVRASPVHVGSGSVRCAHGIVPVPAPATANILNGVPIYGGRIRGELCTPTGAALLKYFASDFGDMPVMKVTAVGIGTGTKTFDQANIIRVFEGETADSRDTIQELSCNLDDATGEELGFAMEVLMASGALDAFYVPLQMKKSRPGQMLVVISRNEDADRLSQLMLKLTPTLGVRRKLCSRMTMEREMETLDTPYGEVRVKKAVRGDIRKQKPEFEDIARICRETGLSYREVLAELGL